MKKTTWISEVRPEGIYFALSVYATSDIKSSTNLLKFRVADARLLQKVDFKLLKQHFRVMF